MRGHALFQGENAEAGTWLARKADLAAIAAWTLLVGLVALARQEYIGDGLRHLPHVLSAPGPALGEPRWLFFPALLYLWIAPFKAVGLVTDVSSAARAFQGLDVLAGAIYMLSLRSILVARGIESPGRRAALLAVAGVTGPVLTLASNTAEPMAAAAIAALGLAYLARGARADDRSGSAILLAVGFIAIASTIYEGMILALGFIPALTERRAWSRPAVLVGGLSILLGFAALAVLAGMLLGLSPAAMLQRTIVLPANVLYITQLRGAGGWKYAVAVLAGPALGVVPIPGFHGLAGIVSSLRGPHTTVTAIMGLIGLLTGLAAVATALLTVIRQRRAWMLLPFASVLVLPVVWNFEYAYIKFYILLPLFLALALAGASNRSVIVLVAVLGAVNGVLLFSDVTLARAAFGEREPFIARADSSTCWLSEAWGPRFGHRWPGRVCSILGTLAGGHGDDVDRLTKANGGLLLECLDRCFCEGASTWTDDVSLSSDVDLRGVLRQYRFEALDASALEWSAARGSVALQGTYASDILAFSATSRREACAAIRAARVGVAQ